MRIKPLIVSAAALCVMLTGCGDTSKIDGVINGTTTTVSRVTAPKTEKGSGTTTTAAPKADTATTTTANTQDWRNIEVEDIDYSDTDVIDLTKMDGAMVYATVFDMMNQPDNYLGKRITMHGTLAVIPSDMDPDLRYYFVVIADATACCSQGIEFIWEENSHTYPDEYPEVGAQVIVSGIFGQYEEEGSPYYYVAADSFSPEE